MVLARSTTWCKRAVDVVAEVVAAEVVADVSEVGADVSEVAEAVVGVAVSRVADVSEVGSHKVVNSRVAVVEAQPLQWKLPEVVVQVAAWLIWLVVAAVA